MHTHWSRPLTRLATLALVAPLAACIVVPAGGRYHGGGAVVAPSVQGEVLVGPAPGLVWVAPGWGWAGGRREWREGHWHRR